MSVGASRRRSLVEQALERIRSEVRGAPRYHLEPHCAEVKLDQNESPYALPEPVRAEIERAFAELAFHRYPELSATDLNEALGALNDWPADGVLVGNGSNELLQMLALGLLEKGRTALAPAPSFSNYAHVTRISGADLVEVPLDEDLAYDAGALVAAAARSRPALVFVAAPNNPTGSPLHPDAIRAIAERAPGIVAVDEAYVEFSESSARDVLAECPRVVLLRTFSKAVGLAGLRIGYLLAHREIASELGKALLPYRLNRFSRAAALAACRHYGAVRERARQVVEQREAMRRRLEAMEGIRAYPSAANFILFECAKGARPVFEGLLARGVLVRDVSSHPRLRRSLRVSIGLPAENERFLAALAETLEELA